MGNKECDGRCDSCSDFDNCSDDRKKPFEKVSGKKEAEADKLKNTLQKIKHKIAVISGKGGVGKSTVTTNLAMVLAMHGHRVGILDADIHGPSIPRMLGISRQRLSAGPPGIFPVFSPLGIKVVSMDFLLSDEDEPVIWRGPLKMGVIRQFLSDIVWGDLDFLLVDLPPGTGDEPLSVMQLIPDMDGAVIVTIPSEVSQAVVKKSVNFTRRLKVPALGIIENMSGFVCPNCGAEIDILKVGGGKKIAEDLNAPFLGSIPIDPRICEDCDDGIPFIANHSDSPSAEAFMKIVERIDESLKQERA